MKRIKKIVDSDKGFYFEDINSTYFGIYYFYNNKYKDYWLNDDIIGYSINEYIHREFYI